MDQMDVLIGALSVLSGLIVGFLAEPIKAHVENRRRKDQLRKALYGECASNYIKMEGALQLYEEHLGHVRAVDVWATLSAGLECYKYAKSEPLLYYQLKEAPTFNALYISWELLNREQLGTEVDDTVALAKTTIQTVDSLIKMGMLDKKLFSKMGGSQATMLRAAGSEKRQKKSGMVQNPGKSD